MESSKEKYIKEILKHLKRWALMAGVLRFIHITLGILAVVFSILVASKINSIDKIYIEWFAFTAAVAIGLQTGFDLGNKANRMRKAWRLLNWSLLKFNNCEKHTLENLIDDYMTAEEIVGDVKETVK